MKMIKTLPEFLKDYLYYEEVSGEFRWKLKPSTSVEVGDLVGPNRVTLFGEKYSLNRVAWFFSRGEDVGELYIDHINGNRSDNGIDNLRPAEPSQNSFNAKLREDNSSGVKGVSKARKGWRASVRHFGERSVEYHKTLEEAEAAAIRMRSQLHTQFARNY